jgi:hypothetical protein
VPDWEGVVCIPLHNNNTRYRVKQCCGSGFTESGYGTSISNESGSRVLMTKIEEEK